MEYDDEKIEVFLTKFLLANKNRSKFEELDKTVDKLIEFFEKEKIKLSYGITSMLCLILQCYHGQVITKECLSSMIDLLKKALEDEEKDADKNKPSSENS